MQFNAVIATALAGLALANAQQGWTVSPDQPDGVYQVTTDANGNEKHVPLNGTVGTNSAGRRALSAFVATKRVDDFGAVQGCGNTALNPADTDAANAALDQQCGNNDNGAFADTAGQDKVYSKNGGTIAYFCVAGPRTSFWKPSCSYSKYPCSSYYRGAISADITNKCGKYKPGWSEKLAGTCGNGDTIRYGYAGVNDQICGGF